MGRPLRVWEPGAVYHVTPKGNDGRTIFFDDRDRRDMLVRMDAAAEKYGARFHGYCLMDNHLHYLIESGKDGLSRLLQVVLGGYSRGWNRRHGGEGHAFRNHVYAVHVKAESHYWNAVRYVDMNPVAAGIVRHPEEWPWSSFPGHAGLEPPPRFLDVAGFLAWFGADPARARARYLRFVARWRPPRASLDPVTAARLLEVGAGDESLR